MTRVSYPTGVTGGLGGLHPLTREALSDEIGYRGYEGATVEGFVDRLAEIVGSYGGELELQKESRISEAKARLADLKRALARVEKELSGLDGFSRELLGEAVANEPQLPQLKDHVDLTVTGFQALWAAHHVQSIPVNRALVIAEQEFEQPSGPSKDYARLVLAMRTADLIQKHLQMTPTSTPHSVFTNVLAILIKDISGKARDPNHIPAVGELARRALKNEYAGTSEVLTEIDYSALDRVR